MDLEKVSIQKNLPATENDIRFSENRISGNIPEVYKQFLRETNGMILDKCILYDTESIVEIYRTNQFEKYAPDYLSIGNDNGDRELIMEAEKDACMCGFLDAGAIGTAEPDKWFELVPWIESGCRLLEEKADSAQRGTVFSVEMPNDKLKFLMDMKKIFALSITTSTLLKEVKELPYIVVKGITGAKAEKLISRTNYREYYAFSYDKK